MKKFSIVQSTAKSFFAAGLYVMAFGNFAHAETMAAYGLNLNMTAQEISDSLSIRGMTCELFDQNDFPIDGQAANISTKNIVVCGDMPVSEQTTSLISRMEIADAALTAYSDRLFADFDNTINEPGLPNATRNFLDLYHEASNIFKIIIYHETKQKKSLMFSCATFNSCGRPVLEIRNQLTKDIDHDSYEAILARPQILTDIYNDAYSVSEIDPVLNMAMPFTSVDTLNFDEGISGCLFLAEDRMCIYDGALRLDALNIMLAVGKVPSNPDLLSLLTEFKIPLRMFWLERDLLASGSLSFQ